MKKQINKLFLLFFLFLCIVGARAQTISHLEYWFDNHFNSRNQIESIGSEVLINNMLPASLSDGLHFVHFRAGDNGGLFSPVHSQAFYKLPASATGLNVTAYEYWVDDDFSSRVSASATGQVFALSESL
ncbi:MAG: hypothetical protein JXR27_12905, partial [Paludibacteraceae bacterium]|nr:hypothetical protein [Paludibacteraceae bacterium]